jgi:hypothetical protein
MINKMIKYKDDGIVKSPDGLIPAEVYKMILDNVPLVCVDLVIVKNNSAFLIKRRNKPCEGIYWVQGGRMEKNEGVEECGLRNAAAERGTSAHFHLNSKTQNRAVLRIQSILLFRPK